MLTREEFQSVYEHGPDATFALFTALQEQVGLLSARVADLEARLNKDSHNSNKPPSSDGLGKKPVSLRAQTGRKPGGQTGHKGCTLALVDTPDAVKTHLPAVCACCHHSLAQVQGVVAARKQVVDVPLLRLLVTEHQVQRKTCAACGHVTQAAFPPHVVQPVQYGPQVQALGVYLTVYQLLPLHRTSELLGDLLGASLCPATLLACQQRAGAALAPAVQQIARAVCHSAVTHHDESGLRVRHTLHWLHVACTTGLTHYSVHKKRGTAGINAAGILPHLGGTAVHDGWKPYLTYAGRHALCNAHHLRELIAVYEADPHPQTWAHTLQRILRDGKHAVEAAQQAGQSRLAPDVLASLVARYQQSVQQGYAANPPPDIQTPKKRGRVAQSTARNLLDRLSKYQTETLRFLHDLAVPFDNNQAERDVRMIKVQQKISGGFRTVEGADAFCTIRSYISTLRKQSRHVLSALQQVFEGHVPSPLPLPE